MSIFSHILGFFILFTLLLTVTYLTQKLYYESIDPKVYFNIGLPVQTDKPEYKAGEFMLLQSPRQSEISVHADSVQELVLVSSEGEQIEVFHELGHVPLLEGESDVSVRVRIPEDIPEGTYFWHGIFSFDLRGIQKSYSWYSVNFTIVK